MTQPTPRVQRALDLVVRDARQDQLITRAEALLHVYDVVDPRTVHGDDELAEAYRTVLHRLGVSVTRIELSELIVALSAESVVQLTDVQEFWILRLQRGDVL